MDKPASRLHLPSPYRLVELDAVDSTNGEARRLAEDGAKDSTLIWAKSQTGGRGRRGRAWASPEGNLYFSILLRPPYPVQSVMQLGFVMANAIADALAVILPRGAFVHTKWPNDVLVEGRKVAGILMEGQSTSGETFEWVVIGVGINVASHPDASDVETPATSLAAEGVGLDSHSVQALLDTLAKRFLAGQATWRNLGFGPIRRAWLVRAKGMGGPVTVRLPNETLSGIFAALDEEGALVLHLDDTPNRRITAGDVFLSPDPVNL